MCLGVPGQVVSIAGSEPLTRTAKVRFGGVVKDVNLAYAPEAKTGDYVIVHVGFAISILNEGEAQRALATLKELGELETP
jgi:hydrogenase expression/formation protein HypC